MGCFLIKKSYCWQRYFQKALELCGMGALSVNPFTEKLSPNIVWNGGGGKSEMKVHTVWVFSNFHFRACYYPFWLRRSPPPGKPSTRQWVTSQSCRAFNAPFRRKNCANSVQIMGKPQNKITKALK